MCKKAPFQQYETGLKSKISSRWFITKKPKSCLKSCPNILIVKTTSSARLKNLKFGPPSLTHSLILYAVRGTGREGGNVYKSGAWREKWWGRGETRQTSKAPPPLATKFINCYIYIYITWQDITWEYVCINTFFLPARAHVYLAHCD